MHIALPSYMYNSVHCHVLTGEISMLMYVPCTQVPVRIGVPVAVKGEGSDEVGVGV